jgi:hypothetical protein
MPPPSRPTAARRVYLALRATIGCRGDQDCHALTSSTLYPAVFMGDKASSPSRRGRCSSRFVRTLIGSFAFLRMSFDAGKQNLWEGDPVGYVRLSVGTSWISFPDIQMLTLPTDEYESFGTPVSAATSFLFSLASNRTKTTFMPILGFIVSPVFLRFHISFLLYYTPHTLAFVFSAHPSHFSSLTSIVILSFCFTFRSTPCFSFFSLLAPLLLLTLHY